MDALGTRREYFRRHHGKTIHFLAPGVEKQSRQPRGHLLYGTENDYVENPSSGRYTLCADQSSWEKLKIKRQQRDAEDDLWSHHKAKQHEQYQIAEEKRKDLQLLQNYNPWGKPAPGAPRWTPSGSLLARGDAVISRQKEGAMEGDVEPFIKERSDEYSPFGRPGAGAPLKSQDGHVDASVRAHPETRFQRHLRREVENSLRYKGAMEGQAVQPPLTRSQSEEERLSQRRCQQSRYAQRLEDQMEEAQQRKRLDKMEVPLSFFPWGHSSPQRDRSGKLLARRKPNSPAQPQFQSIVDQFERIGKRDHLTSRCTHPFTHGSRCQLHVHPPVEMEAEKHTTATTSTTHDRIVKQSHSLPATSLEWEAEERQRRRRGRDEGRTKRNSHHALWGRWL